MNERSPFRTLRFRILLNFLLLLSVLVIATFYMVQSRTYEHSTGQLLAHAKTSANVIEDKIHNRSDALHSALNTLSKDFSFKQLVATGENDEVSLKVALENHQRRNNADIAWVLNQDLKMLAGTLPEGPYQLTFDPSVFVQEKVRLRRFLDSYFLVRAAPVKFVESSRKVNAWVLMGINTKKLISDELVELTDMDVSVLEIGATHKVVGTTFPSESADILRQLSLNISQDLLHQLPEPMSHYLYITEEFGRIDEEPAYLLLTTQKEKAYVSYRGLLLQLVGILAIAAFMAGFAAMFLSKGITAPITRLVRVTKQIRQGEYVTDFPTSTTNEVAELSAAIDDMQKGIRSREMEIQHLAFHNPLTELPNRNNFIQYLETTIAEGNSQLVLLMMDLDRFKDINDTVGHEIGDELLKDIAKRLKTGSYPGMFIAHIGGDEFGLIFSHTDGQDVKNIANNILALFQHPFQVDQLTLDVDVSIGVAVYPDNADSVHDLLQCADIALYSCKGHHYSIAVYDPSLDKHSVQRLSLMSELRGAISQGQLVVYYQPKLNIAKQKIDTAECLVRWIHPTHGFIPPDEFIPLAEQTGAIRDLTHWVLRQGFAQQAAWRKVGYDIGIAVNISALDLVDMTLPAYVAELMLEFHTSSDMLTLEVTESAVMSEPESAVKALCTLQRMGIALSIDDFGTGYSSMAQLKKMPVDELKIDKAFVLDLANNESDQVMVRTLLSLAQNLNLNTVAEGVEDATSLQLLGEMGCTKAQGFYLSRPLAAPDFTAWLTEYEGNTKDSRAENNNASVAS